MRRRQAASPRAPRKGGTSGLPPRQECRPPDLEDLRVIEEGARRTLLALGEDPSRQGLEKTPGRVARSLKELTAGYWQDVDRIINNALFDVDYSEMVVVKDIVFYSLCEHHLLPFFGKATVGYVPDKKIVGLSKIPKIVQVFARRLQVQERMTLEIAHTLERKLKPKGVGVVIRARHLCMEMRGAQSQLSPTVTSALLGAFRSDARTREEFLTLARRPDSQ
ncbi:MAG: GTP cyclohydrolase I FolE [Elusimicrobia bacterium]|nr:GTP cyclohydrolase I FolE [Elusimicrobiota bacterium]